MDEFDPYHKWLGISKKYRPPTHYQLLAIEPDETDPDVIEEAAVKVSTHLRSYQIGAQAALCTKILNEVAQARITLLNSEKRKTYDAALAARAAKTTAAAPAKRPTPEEIPMDEEDAGVTASPPRRKDKDKKKRGKAVDIQRRSNTPLFIGLGVGGGTLLLGAIVLLAVFAFRKPAPLGPVAVNPPVVNPIPPDKNPPIAKPPVRKPPVVKINPVDPPNGDDPTKVAKVDPKIDPPIDPNFKPSVKQPAVPIAFEKPAPVRLELPVPDAVKALGWHDKPFLAFADQDPVVLGVTTDNKMVTLSKQCVQLTDLKTGQSVREWNYPLQNGFRWVSPTLNRIWARHSDNNGMMIDLEDDRVIFKRGVPGSVGNCHCAVSADGKRALVVERTVYLLDGETGKETDTFPLNARFAMFKSDPRLLVVAAGDKLFDYDIQDEKIVKEYAIAGQPIRIFASPDGNKLYFCHRWNVEEIDLPTNTKRPIEATGATAMAFSQDGVLFAVSDFSGQITVGRVDTGKTIKRFRPPNGGGGSLAFAFGSRCLMVANNFGVFGYLWEAEMPDHREQLLRVNLRNPRKVRFLPDGQSVVVMDADGIARIGLPKGQILKRYAKENNTHDFDLSPDGKTIAYTPQRDDKRIYLINTLDGKEIGVCKGAQGQLRLIGFSPSGQFLFGTDDLSEFVKVREPHIRLWNAQTRALVGQEPIDTNNVYQVGVFSPDSSKIHLGSYPGNEIRTYDVNPLKLRDKRPSSSPSKIIVSPHYPWAIVPSNFNLSRRMMESDDPVEKLPPLGVTDGVFTADGKHLVLATNNQRIRILAMPEGREVGILPGHSGRLSSLALSPDEQLIATVSEDEGCLRVWSMAKLK